MPQANTKEFPGVYDVQYELWEQGNAIIQPLPAYAARFEASEHLYIDGAHYKVEAIEHYLTSRPDWPGPTPPETDMGYDFVLCKVLVTIL